MNDSSVRDLVFEDFRCYKKWKARLKAISNEIDYYKITTSSADAERVQSGSGPSDPTFKAVQRIEKLKIEYNFLAHKMNRVDACLDAMTEAQRNLVSWRFFEDQFTRTVQQKLGIEKTEYYKRVDVIVHLCAEICGYMTEKG